MQKRLIPILAFWLVGTIPALAGGGHYPITRDQVAAAVTGGGLPVSADDVSLLADVVSRVDHPILKLKSIEPAPDHQVMARLECADSAQCLPFVVLLRVNDGAASPLEFSPKSAAPSAPLVHAGSSATLQLEGAHVHITLPVICLENGTLGQVIRAANPDRHQFYMVVVVGDRLLRGSL